MPIDITGANIYFGASVHVKSEAWTRIPQTQRIAAVAHATRLIESRLDDPIETDATLDGDFPRHDAAVYEQALWMLQQIEQTAQDAQERTKRLAKGLLTGSPQAAIQPLTIAPEALRHLVLNPRSVRLGNG